VKYHVVVLPRAKGDTHDIDDYLSAHNPAVADRFFENLQATLDLQAALATPGSPWISRNPALVDLRWTRVKGFANYVIFLRVRGHILEVVRLLHAAQDLEAALSR
jgi:toxin ParE1/3/4